MSRVARGRYRYNSELNVGALFEIQVDRPRVVVVFPASMTFALSTIGLNGTGSGTGDCGFNCPVGALNREQQKEQRQSDSREAALEGERNAIPEHLFSET